MGYLFGDGSLRIKKSRQVEAAIECADKVIVEEFANICRRLLKRDVGKIHTRKRSENWRETYSFYCKFNKEFSKILFSLSPTYRTKPKDGEFPKIRIPEIIYKNEENAINFLQAIANSEGSVQLRVAKHGKWFELTRFVKISCSHPQLLHHTALLLMMLGIENRKHPKKKPVSVIIQQKESLVKFSKKIGFLRGIKVGNLGRWKGYDKNFILKTAIASFELPYGRLQRCNNIQDCYNFLKINYPPEMDSETRVQVLRGAAGAKISQCSQE